DIQLDSRYAEGRRERLPEIAAELVEEKVDVIITANEPALRAAKQATTTIPIVVLAMDYDPLASRLIDSLSRPGGNVTGVSLLQTQLLGKRLEILKEALPRTRRVIVFWDSFSRKQLKDLEPAARTLNVQLSPVEVPSNADFTALFRRAKEKADAGMFLFSPAFFLPRAKIAVEARRAGLPTMFQEPWYTAAGGLLSYGPDITEALRRVAYFVDRLLKGAKPSDLPVEQITKFHLAVNLKTAKALGVRIPESVLMRADEVIR
ncbi:MAG: ABC transporter substrate-binding protein, partial [Burkholderiales bacterium]